MLRQYDRWSVEEEQIFFLKLHTSSALSLLVCFRCIAELLPNKDYNQVRQIFGLVMQQRCSELFFTLISRPFAQSAAERDHCIRMNR